MLEAERCICCGKQLNHNTRDYYDKGNINYVGYCRSECKKCKHKNSIKRDLWKFNLLNNLKIKTSITRNIKNCITGKWYKPN